MIDYIIIGLLLILVIPKMRLSYDEKGFRLIVLHMTYYNEPTTLYEGFRETITQYWFYRNKDWWDKYGNI